MTRDRLLTWLFVGLIASIVLAVFSPPAGFLLAFVIEIVSTEVVYQDAKALNKLAGRELVNPTGWSLFTFLLAIVALPWYIYGKRKNILSQVQPLASSQNPSRFCTNCGSALSPEARFCAECGREQGSGG